jgi:hypothetical protein
MQDIEFDRVRVLISLLHLLNGLSRNPRFIRGHILGSTPNRAA